MRKIIAKWPGPPKRLKLQTCDEPSATAGEVLIKVEAAGVNFADCVARMGLYKSSWDLVGWPLTPGFEVAGTIVDSSDTGFAVGARVVAVTLFGGYAETVSVPQRQVFAIPPRLSMVQAAALPVSFLTALHAMELAAPPPDGIVLVHSASGAAGLAITQVARLQGCRVVGIVGTDSKRQAALHAGCDEVIVRNRNWSTNARALSPEGYAAIFDASGDTLAQSARLVAPMGRLVAYGSHGIIPHSGRLIDVPVAILHYLRMPRFSALQLANRNLSVMAFNLSYLFDKGSLLHVKMNDILGMVADHHLEPPPIRVYSLEVAREAHADLHSGRTVGKLVLTMCEPLPTLG